MGSKALVTQKARGRDADVQMYGKNAIASLKGTLKGRERDATPLIF